MSAGQSSGEIKEIAVAADELANALTGGDARWTISARCWANRDTSRIAAFMVWALNFVQKGHCKIAYEKMIGLEERDTGSLKP